MIRIGIDCGVKTGFAVAVEGNSGVRDKTVELAKLKQAIADYESI